jgi:penicillin-binding protein 1A
MSRQKNLSRMAGRPPARPKRHWLRWLVLGAFLLVVMALVAVAALGGSFLDLAKGTPALASLEQRVPAQTTMIYDSRGRLIAQLHGAVDRIQVPSARLPVFLKEATVAVEDKRFYHHHGVDFQAIVRAALADLRAGRAVQGGSTITEQYVKNAYLGGNDTLRRKVQEAILAWELEDQWSKDRILTAYLNTVYYGNGAYGAQAAAQTYFHKDVSHLTLAQAALLAGLPQDPAAYSPIYDPADAVARRDLVLQDMAGQGYITQAQGRSAMKAKLRVFRSMPPGELPAAAYFIDYVVQQLVARYGARETFEGGLRVHTTLDLRMQQDALQAMKGILPAGPAGALVSIDPTNGFIRAMTTTLDWRTTKFDLAWQAHRQLGSAMKPFALVAAVEAGANPATTYYTSQPLHIFLGPQAVPPVWDVATFSNTYAGRINLVNATWQSDNTVFAQLALDLGPAKIVAVAHAMGIQSPLTPWPSIVLGTEVVDPLEVADAYATLANEGIRYAPQAISKVVFASGDVARAKVRGKRVVPAGVAYVVDSILQGNTRYGTAAAMPSYYTGTAAGKTGTTSNSADAWFCGFNPKLATAVWMGYPQAEIPMPGVQGATYCVPIWGTYYNLVFGKQTIAGFAQPAVMPAWKPWHGLHATTAPAPSSTLSPSPTATKPATGSGTTPRPKPVPTKTATTTPSPTTSP